MIKILLFIMLTSCTFLNAQLAGATVPIDNPPKADTNLQQALQRVMPAVVNIAVTGQLPLPYYPLPTPSDRPYPNQKPSQLLPPKFHSQGSGVIVDAQQGYIITNAHVVRDAQAITVTLNDGRRLKAQKIGADDGSDIAVIKVKAVSNLMAITFGNSSQLQVGDFVAAIGNPFALRQTVTSGVVSALNRNELGIEGYENFIQTDAPINPGNSGGALINTKGELVGINTAILSAEGGSIGIGFAIPSNMAKGIMEQLIKYGKVERGVLGVVVQDLTPNLADAFHVKTMQGALITQVLPKSPAEQAGLKAKDIITKIDGNKVANAAEVRTNAGLIRVGDKVELEILRDNKYLTVKTTVIDNKKLLADDVHHSSLLTGVRLRDFAQLVPSIGLVKGVEVLAVDDVSDAWVAGLRPSDIILSANDKDVTSLKELLMTVSSNNERILLKILRAGEIIAYLVIED